MTHHLQFLKDTLGQNYLGIKFDTHEIEPFLNQLQEHLGDSFEDYRNNQQLRDNGYHLTFMSVMEFNKKSKELGLDRFTKIINHLVQTSFDDIKLLGIGTAEKAGNNCFYIVVNSELLDESRKILELDEKDFHITIGFKWKDVHGVRKNQVMEFNSKFLHKLKSSFIQEGESFDFIKGFSNFDLDFYKLIEPIEINETNAIFRCGENDYIQIGLIDDKLTITGKWQETNKLPILADTLIQRKFKQI